MKITKPVRPDVDWDKFMKKVAPGKISHGGHSDPSDGMCVMEAVSYVTNANHSDHPKCVHPFLVTQGIHINDLFYRDAKSNKVADADRTRALLPLVLQLIGTNSSDPGERGRLETHFILTAKAWARGLLNELYAKAYPDAPVLIPGTEPYKTMRKAEGDINRAKKELVKRGHGQTLPTLFMELLDWEPAGGLPMSMTMDQRHEYLVMLLASVGHGPEPVPAVAVEMVKDQLAYEREVYNRAAVRMGWPLDMGTDDDITEENALDVLAELSARATTSAVKLEPAKVVEEIEVTITSLPVPVLVPVG